MAAKLKIKKGDQVQLLAGADKGKRGEVVRVMPAQNRVIVQGANMATKHRKPSMAGPGGRDSMELPVHVSNVALIDPSKDAPTRVGVKIAKDGQKQRIAKKSGEVLA